MKNLLKKIRFSPPLGGGGLLLGLLLAYALNSCSLFPEPDPTLPPITQNGAETFGCLVNGKVFVPKGNSKYPAVVKIYNGWLNIFATRISGNEIGDQIGISIADVDKTGDYYFTEKKLFRYFGQNCTAGLDDIPINGKVVITKFERGEDKTNNLKWLIVSGTFEGTILPSTKCSDTIKITQGRFDLKLQ